MRLRRFWTAIRLCLAVVLAAACGGSPVRIGSPPSVPDPAPQAARVFLIVMENESYADMVGSQHMPYLNSLIPQGAIADNFFANTHPSIGNYFMLTTGKIITNSDSFD